MSNIKQIIKIHHESIINPCSWCLSSHDGSGFSRRLQRCPWPPRVRRATRRAPWCPASLALRSRRGGRGDRVADETKWTQGTGEGGGDALRILDFVERQVWLFMIFRYFGILLQWFWGWYPSDPFSKLVKRDQKASVSLGNDRSMAYG